MATVPTFPTTDMVEVEVTAWTRDFKVYGILNLSSDVPLSEFLNQEGDFISLLDAAVYNADTETGLETKVFALNKRDITLLCRTQDRIRR